MIDRDKRVFIYTILCIAIITILVITFDLFTSVNKPVIQGSVECKTYLVSSKIAGRIDSIFVAEGDWVERGELLYTISTPELDNKLKQVEALRQEAKAFRDEVERGARKQQIEAARSMVEKAKAGASLAQTTFDRISRLYSKGVVARQQYDEAIAELEAMNANLLAANAEYSLALAGATSEQREIVAAKYSEASSVVDEVNLYIGDSKVTAPASGIVSTITSNSGELIGTGFPVITITNTDECWATFNIREDEMEQIEYGKRFKAFIPALKSWAEFNVYYIASEADFATWTATRARGGFDIKTFEIRAKCRDKSLKILPGMSVIIYKI
ncbi:MAG: efflux RND transporter periplasmic adaptor subunit [Alistipes sp.]|nr:efflux RND transporter periplasmic adaptor subunit [Alistipes sp.]